MKTEILKLPETTNRYHIVDIRKCDTCGDEMSEGFKIELFHIRYFCSEYCRRKKMKDSTYMRHYKNETAYFTQWENKFTDSD